ncbi:MAG: 50S ribosomal protein L25 [Candidatus Spechtbacterales bacterium]
MLHLKVKKRDPDKIKAKDLLKEGSIPGVMYGPRIKPISLSVNKKTFLNVYKEAGETTLIALDMKVKTEESEAEKERGEDNKDTQAQKQEEEDNVVLVRDVQVHPVSGEFVHIDFYQLPMDTEIEISIDIESINEAPAVKEQGGVLVQNMYELPIKALPKDLIHGVEVDISVLENIEDSILVQDLNLPSTVTAQVEQDEVVFKIEEPREEEPEEEEDETLEGDEDDKIAEIKTESEEKREEREAEEDSE